MEYLVKQTHILTILYIVFAHVQLLMNKETQYRYIVEVYEIKLFLTR